MTSRRQLDANLALILAARPRTGDPVADADQAARMAGLRREVCLAAGVRPQDIGPQGHDHSAAGYARVRASWMSHVEQWGIAMFDETLAGVIETWQGIRPDLMEGDDWRAEAERLHKAAYPDGACFYGDHCVICFPIPEEWLR